MRSLALLGLLAGCNQVFGLVQTAPAPAPDTDGDGVPDDSDNCPLAPNPDQADSDGDGVGDACDLCPGVASPDNHDEDADRIGDPCDPCPGDADSGADSDGDGVGDVCDPDFGGSSAAPSAERRLYFDPFVTIEPMWITDGAPWFEAGDVIAPTSATGGVLRASTVNATVPIQVEFGVIAPRVTAMGDRLAIELDTTGGTPWATCGLIAADTTGHYELFCEYGGQVQAAPSNVYPGPVRVIVTATATQLAVRSEQGGVNGGLVNPASSPAQLQLALATNVVAYYEFIDVIVSR